MTLMMRQLHSWGKEGDLSVCDPPFVKKGGSTNNIQVAKTGENPLFNTL